MAKVGRILVAVAMGAAVLVGAGQAPAAAAPTKVVSATATSTTFSCGGPGACTATASFTAWKFLGQPLPLGVLDYRGEHGSAGSGGQPLVEVHKCWFPLAWNVTSDDTSVTMTCPGIVYYNQPFMPVAFVQFHVRFEDGGPSGPDRLCLLPTAAVQPCPVDEYASAEVTIVRV